MTSSTWKSLYIEHFTRSLLTEQSQIDLDFTWLYIYSSSLFFSFATTLLATYHMRRLGGNVFRSTVHFVTTNFLISSSLRALWGCVFYSILTIEMYRVAGQLRNELNTDRQGRFMFKLDNTSDSSGKSDLPTLPPFLRPDFNLTRVHDGFLKPDNRADGPEAAYISLENIFFVLTAYWIVLLTLELYNLAKVTYDRGGESERKVIRMYGKGAILIAGLFSIVLILKLCIYNGHITVNGFRFVSILEMVANILSILYSTWALWDLKRKGRKNEHIHGICTASPLYRRLKSVMMVCAVCTLPYCTLQILLLSINKDKIDTIPDYIVGVALTLYYLLGAAQALVMGGSQQCCLRLLEPCIPSHVRDDPEWRSRYIPSTSFKTVLEMSPAPLHPIFVNTDIESSTSLWSLAPQHVINEAQQIHDDTLRSTLPKYRGYEITTAGDAFQLAFHTIEQAVGYCLEVQVLLLRAKWPRELKRLVKTEHVIHGLKVSKLFSGLRVRMGIHDTCEDEGSLVAQTHPVTGKTVYIGASELIGREISDVGYGGQIIITERIATYLQTFNTTLEIDGISYIINGYGPFEITTLGLCLELYEIIPTILSKRKQNFNLRRQREVTSVEVPGEKTNNFASDDDALAIQLQESTATFHRYQQTPNSRPSDAW